MIPQVDNQFLNLRPTEVEMKKAIFELEGDSVVKGSLNP